MSKFWVSASFLFVLACCSSSALAQEPTVVSAIYGCWKIGQTLGTADVYGMTDNQIQNLIGKTICYSDQAVTAESEALHGPLFRKTSYDADDFFRWFHAPLALFGVDATVSVFEIVDNNGRPVRFLGDTVFLKNAEQLVLARDGVFYLACKGTTTCAVQEQSNWGGYKKIGFGHLVGPGEDFSSGVTQDQAEALAKRDSQFASQVVNSAVAVKITQTKFDAMVALAYDIGNGAFAHSGLVSALNGGRTVQKEDLTQFDMSNGKGESQLKESRLADWNLFSKGKYKN